MAQNDLELSPLADPAMRMVWRNFLSVLEWSRQFAGGVKGDIWYHDGTRIVKRSIGTPGQVLKVGADGLPTWV